MFFALAWATFHAGGTALRDCNASVLGFMCAAFAVASPPQAPPLRKVLSFVLLILPLWVSLQMAPLPLELVAHLSPIRAHMAQAIDRYAAVSLSVYPAGTFAEWMRLV